ncbi:sulfotransferase [Ferrimonas balearica]|uniref:sulfotransferase n=1 Tax=Ferrimonas balearica TaxID=44012 RepID=UPI001C573E50|nr:sulfotransferase [Ferrimonas balearica]MBW3162948.1 sulfotransferase [Ferrimonas balearica]
MAHYSVVERWMHKLVFAVPLLEETLKGMESTLYAEQWQQQTIDRPIFIAGLPRAGTTLLLELLGQHSDTTSYSYRDMPFIQSPVIWQRASRWFTVPESRRERMHGDGIEIGFDSPEAFEEVIWRKAFPEYYRPDGIRLWDEAEAGDRAGLAEHVKKLLWLRQGRRYLSKNNGNVARLKLIRQRFADARILVPFRRPIDHAQSMLRQHRRFRALHQSDPFNRQYMAYIGHFEFGQLHKPVAFPDFAELSRGHEPDSLAYWLAYWVAAYRHLYRQGEGQLLHFDGLCRRPEQGIAQLLDAVALTATPELLQRLAKPVRPAPPRAADRAALPTALLEAAEQLYQALQTRSLPIPSTPLSDGAQ